MITYADYAGALAKFFLHEEIYSEEASALLKATYGYLLPKNYSVEGFIDAMRDYRTSRDLWLNGDICL